VTGNLRDTPEQQPSPATGERAPAPAESDGRAEVQPAADAAVAPAAPPAVAPTVISDAFRLMHEAEPTMAAALQREWGADAAANLGYVRWLGETFLTREQIANLPNDPALFGAAAALTRRLFHDGNGKAAELPSGAMSGVLRSQIDMLRRKRIEARARFDHGSVEALNQQIEALYARAAPGVRMA
jgi:hypothetical protein